MRKSHSKRRDNPLNSKKEENQYAQFLQKKLHQEQYLTHLVNLDTKTLVKENAQLKQLIAKLRSGQKQSKLKLQGLQNDNKKLQQTITKLQERHIYLQQKVSRIESQKQKQVNSTQPLETKIVFKQFITNTFPTYKDTIKRILRFFMYIEKYEQKGKQQRIKAYHEFIKSMVEKIMLFIFPKKSQNQMNKSLAGTMVEKWKSNQTEIEKELNRKVVELKNKETLYVKKIQSYEAQMLRVKAAKSVLENKVMTYEKTLKVKASEFVVHFKKALVNKSQYGQQDEAIEQMNQILHILQTVVNSSAEKVESKAAKATNKQQRSDIIGLSNKSLPSFEIENMTQNAAQSLLKPKKQAPILKKNIYGYYVQPQLATQWNFLTSKKHPDLNKSTQTLPDDLTVLITHPVLLLHLFDGIIRPQRTRHNTEFYVKIHKNSESFIDSHSIDSQDYKPLWDRQFLVKNYDFPSLRIELVNKSKGLRDKVLGEGKLMVQNSESKIVNVRKQKEYQGRVRFGIHYPKGNIFEFVINSVQLIVPQGVKILSESVEIVSPMNESILTKFSNSTLINYLTNKSIIIIQGYEGNIEGVIMNRKLSGNVSLQEFTQKQGSKTVVIQAEEWQIVLQGYIVLIVSEQSQPEKISCAEEDKFFAVRAGHPLVSATYNTETLYSHVKWPLVFRYSDEFTCLSCISQIQNTKGKTQEIIMDPLIKPDTQTQLIKHDLLSAPPHIYQFFIQTLQGPQVKFSYQSFLFVKVPQKVKLQIWIEIKDLNQENQQLDPLLKKGKRRMGQKQVQKIQFCVQTKDLMQNFYKIMSRTYKITGYSKFKLGYCKLRNLLTTQGQQSQTKKKAFTKKTVALQQLLDGQYFVQFKISKGYLPSFSSTAKYCVEVSYESQCYRTEFMQGELIVWGYEVLIKLKFMKDKSPQINIRLYELPLIGGQKIVYEANIPIATNIFKLGKLILNLGQIKDSKSSISIKDQNILILDEFCIPNCVYSLLVTDIELEVQEQADWFSKIDPYLVFCVQNRKVYQSKVMDNAGDNAIWQNVNFKIVVPQNKEIDNLGFQMFQCRIFDEDLINDDYLGVCSVLYDPEIADKDGLIDCIRAKITKDEKVCGSMRIHGKFKKIHQQSQKIISHSFVPLTPQKHQLYQICLTEIKFFRQNIIDPEEKLNIQSQMQKSYKFIQKDIDSNYLSNINFSLFWVNQLSSNQANCIEIKLTQRKKHFFKTQITEVGTILISKEQIASQSTICELLIPISQAMNFANQIGIATIFIEPIFQTAYSVIDAYTSGTQLKISSLNQFDCLTLRPTTKQHIEPLMQDFCDMYLISSDRCQLKSQDNVQVKQFINVNNGKKSIREVSYSVENSSFILKDQPLTVFSIHQDLAQSSTPLIFKKSFSIDQNQFSRSHSTNKLIQKLYKIKILHWQPIKFEESKEFKINVKFQHKNQAKIFIHYRLNQVFNSYYAFSSSDSKQNKTMPMIFSESMLPEQLIIEDTKNDKDTKNVIINLHEIVKGEKTKQILKEKHTYLMEQGALYYELQEYKEKYRKIYFKQLYVKIVSKQMIAKYSEGLNNISLGISESQISYSYGKRIGKYGFYFENVEFYVPVENATNLINLHVTLPNLQKLQILLKGKLNKWDYVYESTQSYTIHSVLIIESDISQGRIALTRMPPTLVSFIELQSLIFTPSQNLPNTELSINFSLHNQLIELKATKNQQQKSQDLYEMNQKQLLYIQEGKESIVKVQIAQQKIFGRKVIGWCHILLKEDQLNLEENFIVGQVKNDKAITLGKVQFRYKALGMVKYLYVDIDKIVPKYDYPTIVFELIPFGSNKTKTQRIEMRKIQQTSNQSSHSSLYDTSEDLIVCEQDYQDYIIHVSVRDTNQLLGKFKLCDLVKRQNDNDHEFVSAVHPLKVEKTGLGGLVGINYIEYVSRKEIVSGKNVKSRNGMIRILLKKWRFLNQKKQSIVTLTFNTTNRKLFTKQIDFTFKDEQTSIEVILPQNQKFTIVLQKNSIPKAFSIIDVNKFSKKKQELIVFNNYIDFNQVYGVCMMEIEALTGDEQIFQLQDITARNLEDMEMFVKMNPYVVVEALNDVKKQQHQADKSQIHRQWITQLSEGKSNLYWKMGLLFEKNMKLTLFDKDIKFDDYIGQGIIDIKQFNRLLEQNSSNKLKKQLKLRSLQNNSKQTGQVVATIQKINFSKDTKVQTKQQHSNIERGVYWLMLDEFSDILGEGQHIKSLRIYLTSKLIPGSNCIFSLQNYTEQGSNYQMDVIKNMVKDGLRLDSFIFDVQKSYSNETQIIIQAEIQQDNSKTQNLKQIRIIRQVIELSKLSKSLSEVHVQNSHQQIQALPEEKKLFSSYQLIPLVCSITQSKHPHEIFLIKKLAVWYDYACFKTTLKLIIKIYHSLNNKMRQYSCQLDLSSLDPKKGFSFLDFQTQKYLKHSIWVEKMEIVEVFILDQIANVDKSTINLSQQKQMESSENFFVQSELSADKSGMKVGKLFVELEKIILSNQNLQHLQSLQKIIQRQSPYKSDFSWIQMKVCSASFLKDIEIFSKMDPYCQVQLIEPESSSTKIPQKYKTSVQQNKGTDCAWDQTFFFYVKNLTTSKRFKFKFMDEQVTADRAIGYGQLMIQPSKLSKTQSQIFQLTIIEDQKSIQKTGICKVEYKICSRYIVFLRVKSEKNEIKRSKTEIWYQGKSNKSYQALQLLKPYPLTDKYTLWFRIDASEIFNVSLQGIQNNIFLKKHLQLGDGRVSIQFKMFE